MADQQRAPAGRAAESVPASRTSLRSGPDKQALRRIRWLTAATVVTAVVTILLTLGPPPA